jgi:excisionase family DNA binding protein
MTTYVRKVEQMENSKDAVLVSLPDAARRLGLGLSSVKALVQRDDGLRSIRIGKRRLVPVAAIEEFVARRLADASEMAR